MSQKRTPLLTSCTLGYWNQKKTLCLLREDGGRRGNRRLPLSIREQGVCQSLRGGQGQGALLGKEGGGCNQEEEKNTTYDCDRSRFRVLSRISSLPLVGGGEGNGDREKEYKENLGRQSDELPRKVRAGYLNPGHAQNRPKNRNLGIIHALQGGRGRT